MIQTEGNRIMVKSMWIAALSAVWIGALVATISFAQTDAEYLDTSKTYDTEVYPRLVGIGCEGSQSEGILWAMQEDDFPAKCDRIEPWDHEKNVIPS